MRKQIDLPDDMIKDLNRVAVEDDTNPKNWIESLVINEVKRRTKQKKK